jgi:hypothetical protein
LDYQSFLPVFVAAAVAIGILVHLLLGENSLLVMVIAALPAVVAAFGLFVYGARLEILSVIAAFAVAVAVHVQFFLAPLLFQ